MANLREINRREKPKSRQSLGGILLSSAVPSNKGRISACCAHSCGGDSSCNSSSFPGPGGC